jgi:hypothetical protein
VKSVAAEGILSSARREKARSPRRKPGNSTAATTPSSLATVRPSGHFTGAARPFRRMRTRMLIMSMRRTDTRYVPRRDTRRAGVPDGGNQLAVRRGVEEFPHAWVAVPPPGRNHFTPARPW